MCPPLLPQNVARSSGNGKDCLDNMHANTQIPKVIGYQRIAELAHDVQYHNASEYFWEIVTRQRSLALGGNSRREHFPTKEIA